MDQFVGPHGGAGGRTGRTLRATMGTRIVFPAAQAAATPHGTTAKPHTHDGGAGDRAPSAGLGLGGPGASSGGGRPGAGLEGELRQVAGVVTTALVSSGHRGGLIQ